MRYRRIVSLLLVAVVLCSVMISASAAADPYEEVESTVKPTEPPTIPRPDPKKLGYAAYAKKMDETVYTGQLGAIYSKDSTAFRLWSPAASAVKVCVYKTGSDSEPGARLISSTSMKYSEKTGAWGLTLKGDYKNMYYTYQVTVGDKTNEVVDPYARAVGVNGNRGMIIDLRDTDPDGWDEDSFDRVSHAVEAVVWEANVRDFSADESSGVSEANRGKFLAFTEFGTTLNGKGEIPTCINYLRRLGVNYVQINPFYDFASIDESDTETPQYNWGYDPKNYNVPEGSYSSDPYDGRVRIKECKEMIQALHDAGIGVIMDVVYNHTYYSEDSFFNQIVPYYYHRVNEDGTWSNGSGCGNDVATERVMVSRLIRDSVKYWAQEYHIDGFRFDLMGLMDVDTMNGIRADLDSLVNGDSIIMFGEAWKMTTTVPDDVKLANQDNINLLSKRIGAFNDTARDGIKGSVFNASEGGFVQSGSSKGAVRSAVDGDGGGWAAVPNQCVNYVSCHDNLTLYDKLTATVYGEEGYDLRREDLVSMNKLCAAIIFGSRGMPFLLAGEEMGRTKQGDENSYISPVEINAMDWNRLTRFTSLADYYRGLIKLRASLGVFKDSTGAHTSISYLESDSKTTVAYMISSDEGEKAVFAFNGSPDTAAEVSLPDGEWIMLVDPDRAGVNSLGTCKGTVKVPPTGAVALLDTNSYSVMGSQDDTAQLYVRFTDKATSNVIYEIGAAGAIGETYNIDVPDNILFHYNIVSGSMALDGEFTERYMSETVTCELYEGGYSSVTIKFLDSSDRRISDTIVMTNRVGQQYFTPYLPMIDGYSLDIKKLPANGAGVYTDEPIEVIYRYSPSETEDPVTGEYTCRANVIYISDSGEILATKSYMGDEGSPLEVEMLTFDKYEYAALSDSYAAFSRTEVNVLAYYNHKRSMIPVFLAAGLAAVLLAAGAVFLAVRSKRRKIDSIQIEE